MSATLRRVVLRVAFEMASLSGLALKVVSLCLLLMEFWGAVLVSAGPVSVVPKNCDNIGAVTLEVNDVKEYVCNTATLYREVGRVEPRSALE